MSNKFILLLGMVLLFLITLTCATPSLQFVSPTPDNLAAQNGSSIYVNISSNSSGDHYVLTDFDKSLLGWWTMDSVSGTTVYDSSSYKLNGVITGDLFQTKGKFGKAMSFDRWSGNAITVANNLNLSRDFSVFMWIYPLDCNNMPTIIDKGSATGIGFGLECNPWSGNNYLRLGARVNGALDACVWGCTSSAVINLNQWNFVGFTFNSNSAFNGYVNGVLKVSSQNAGFIGSEDYASHEIVIGADTNNGGRFNGLIDDVMIFNRTLSNREILALYNSSANQYYNNFTNLADGTHTVNAYATDASGNVSTISRVFGLGSSYIGVELNSPADRTFQSSSNVIFNYSVGSLTLDTCTLYGNFNGAWKANLTNSSAVIGSNIFNLDLSPGIYLWNVWCNNSNGFGAFASSNYTLNIGTNSISVNLSSPINNSFFNSNSANFSWLISSSANSNFSCNLTLNGVVYSYNLSSTTYSTTINSLSDGVNFWNVTCSDDYGFSNVSQTYQFTVDTTPPIINIISPNSSIWNSSNNLLFNISANDANGIYSFLNFNNSLVAWWRGENGGADELGKNNLTLGTYTTIVPNGKFGKAFNGSASVGDVPAFQFDGSQSFTISLWKYYSNNSTSTFGIIQKGSAFAGSPGYLLEYHGSKRWQVEVADNNYNVLSGCYSSEPNIANKWFYLTLVYNTTQRNISLYVNGTLRISASTAGLENWDIKSPLTIGGVGLTDEIIIFNRALSQPEIQSLYNGTSFSANFSGSELTNYSYTAYSVDTAGNLNSSSNYVFVDVPNTTPSVNLNYPLQNTRSSITTQTFNCSAANTNLNSQLKNITFYWNYSGNFVADGSSSFSGDGSAVFTKSGLNDKNFSWNCYVCDNLSNCAFASQNNSFTIGQSEFYVSNSGDDSNTGTISSPFKTIQHCASIARPGDACYIRGGNLQRDNYSK